MGVRGPGTGAGLLMRINAKPDVSSMTFRQRLALALAVLFGRDGVVVPLIAPTPNRAMRRFLRRAAR